MQGVNGPATGPLLLWLLVQLAALSVAAFRIPLAAKYPQPGELLAPQVLLVAQIAASALLFPYLLRDAPGALAVVAAVWPFAAVASTLSALPLARAALGETYASLWIAGLALWARVLRTQRARLYGVAVAATVALGGVALWYLAEEFGHPGAPAEASGSGIAALSPIPAALRQLAQPITTWRDWLVPAAATATGGVAVWIQGVRGRASLSTAPAPDADPSRPLTS